MRFRTPWSGSFHDNCTTKAIAELRRPVLRVAGQQQHVVVRQSQQQKWQEAPQAGDLRTLHADISPVWVDPYCVSGHSAIGAPDSSTLAHLAETGAALQQQHSRRRCNTAAETSQQHGSHQQTQQQQPQDMNPSALAAAFLKLLKQQQAATAQQQANNIPSSSSSSSCSQLTLQQSRPYPIAAVLDADWDEHYYQQLLQHTQLMLPQLQPRQASLILYTAAKLGKPPGQQLLAALLQQRLQEFQLQQLPPAGLANVLWALAVMQHSPGLQWMAGFYAACSGNSYSTSASTSGSSSSSSLSPSTGNRRSSSSSGMACLNHHQLCSLLWSLGSLQERPPAEWLQQLLAALRPHLQDLRPSELTNVLWGLAQLGYRPSKGWAKEWFSASSRVLDLQGSAHAAGAVEGSFRGYAQDSRLQYSTEHGQHQQQQQREEKSQQGLPFIPDHLACIAGSLGLLRLDPRSGHWLRSFRHCVVQQLPRMRGAHVATIMCGLAKRRSSQPPHWVWLLVARQLQLLEMQQQQQQRGGLPAAAAAARLAGPAAAAEADAATQPHQEAASYTAHQQRQLQLQPADIAATVWALPRLLYPTAALWTANAAHSAALKALATASLQLLPSCIDAELVQLAVGFAGLRFYPGAHWLKVHENAVAARYSRMSPANRARLRAAVRVMWSDG